MADTAPQTPVPQAEEPQGNLKSKVVTLIVAIPSILTVIFVCVMPFLIALEPKTKDQACRDHLPLAELQEWAVARMQGPHDGALPIEAWPKGFAPGSVRSATVHREPPPGYVAVEFSLPVLEEYLIFEPTGKTEFPDARQIEPGIWRLPEGL